MNLTTENIISTLADAGQPMPSRAIANALGVEHIGKVRALLTALVQDETVERAKGGKYQLRDSMVHEAPTRSANVRREILPTDTAAIKARERRKEKTKVVEVEPYQETNVTTDVGNRLFSLDEIMTLEKAERQADEEKLKNLRDYEEAERVKHKAHVAVEMAEKARDQRIRDAVQRLKSKANFEVKPVENLEFKIEILDGIGSADADLWEVLKDVIADLRRLDELAEGPF